MSFEMPPSPPSTFTGTLTAPTIGAHFRLRRDARRIDDVRAGRLVGLQPPYRFAERIGMLAEKSPRSARSARNPTPDFATASFAAEKRRSASSSG